MRSERGTNKARAWLGLLLLWPALVGAATERSQVSPVEWERALRVAQVPAEVMYAMGLQESGTTLAGQRGFAPWAWVLNVNNQGRFFRTREEASAALAAEVERGNRRVAVGMLQIHLRWNGHRVSDPLTLLDPSVNLRVAADVLAECGQRFPDTFGKLACYYSGDVDEEGRWYARQVLAKAGHRSNGAVQKARRTTHPAVHATPRYMVAAVTPRRTAEDEAFLRSLARDTGTDRQVVLLQEATP
jgi:hypothetical protein